MHRHFGLGHFKPIAIGLIIQKMQPEKVAFFMLRVRCFFERFVLCKSPKFGRFVSNSAKIWICGLYLPQKVLSDSNRIFSKYYAHRVFGLIRKNH